MNKILSSVTLGVVITLTAGVTASQASQLSSDIPSERIATGSAATSDYVRPGAGTTSENLAGESADRPTSGRDIASDAPSAKKVLLGDDPISDESSPGNGRKPVPASHD